MRVPNCLIEFFRASSLHIREIGSERASQVDSRQLTNIVKDKSQKQLHSVPELAVADPGKPLEQRFADTEKDIPSAHFPLYSLYQLHRLHTSFHMVEHLFV